MEKSKLTYQTDKFIIKCDEKNGKWYVVLLNKETEETVIKYFKTQKAAENHYGKVMGWKVSKPKIKTKVKE